MNNIDFINDVIHLDVSKMDLFIDNIYKYKIDKINIFFKDIISIIDNNDKEYFNIVELKDLKDIYYLETRKFNIKLRHTDTLLHYKMNLILRFHKGNIGCFDDIALGYGDEFYLYILNNKVFKDYDEFAKYKKIAIRKEKVLECLE